MWQDRAGIFEHFLAITKRVPRDRETRSNAGLGAAGYIVFLTLDRCLFRLSCGYAFYDLSRLYNAP